MSFIKFKTVKYLLLIFTAVLYVSCDSSKKLRPNVYDLAKLSAHIYDNEKSEKFSKKIVCEDFFESTFGFAAGSYGNEYYKIIVFRGTDNLFDGLADAGLAISNILGSKNDDSVLGVINNISSAFLTNKVKQAVEYYKTAKANENRTLIITGHSLGGFFAQIVGYASGEETHTFNAPGAEKHIQLNDIKPTENINITNHLSYDIISQFGTHVGKDTVYDNYGHSIENFCEFLEKINKE